ncbi:alpha/beta hydrolase [Arthrobacter monumenti]
MSIGYLVGVVVLGACALCALRPVRSHGTLGISVYLVGMVYNEMPILAIGLGVASTLQTFDAKDPVSPSGLVSLGLMVLVLAALGHIAWQAVRSRRVPEQALCAALGPKWRAEISPWLAEGLRTRPRPVRAFLVPFLRRRFDVERISNIAYGDAGRRNRLDVYRNRSRTSGRPVLVHFHGGHFVSGAKNRESLPLIHRMASRGWVCISANYRLGPKASFPDYIVDAKRVLAWVREHGQDYGADSSTLFVAGNSAGGYLASFAALTTNKAEFQPGFEDADTSVAGAICLYGYYGRTDSALRSTPAAHINADAPPFYIVHGDKDTMVPVEWAREFAGALDEVSHQPVIYTELPDAQHSFDYFNTLRTGLVVDRIEAFTAWVRSTREVSVLKPQ